MNILFTLIALVFMINPTEKVTSDVTFCNFELSRNIKTANSSFNVIYSFEVNDVGQPIKITKVKDDHIGEATVASCLERWRFHGSKKDAHMAAVFQWQHGDGWTEISITGPDLSQKIRVSGQRCPYLRMQSENHQRLDANVRKSTSFVH